jgi:hypothetical protein
MTTDESPPTPSRDNPTEDRDTPIPAPPAKRRPGRPPKISNQGTFGRGGGTTRKMTRFDSTLTTMTKDDLVTRTTRNETPSPSPPSPPQKEPDETDNKLPARKAPPIVETVHDDPTQIQIRKCPTSYRICSPTHHVTYLKHRSHLNLKRKMTHKKPRKSQVVSILKPIPLID